MNHDAVGIEMDSLPPQDQIGVLLALHGHRLGGAVVMCQDDPLRAERWLSRISGWRSVVYPPATTIRTPVHCPPEQLLGGVDLIQTVLCGHTVITQGLLEQANHGWLLLPLAELQPSDSVRAVCDAIDHHRAGEHPVSICAIAVASAADLSQLTSGDRAVDAALLDRMAFCLDLAKDKRDTLNQQQDDVLDKSITSALRTAQHWRSVTIDETLTERLCVVAGALGISAIRAQLHCAMVARSAAALAGRSEVDSGDLDVAMSLCFAWRAQALPAHEAPQSDSQADQPEPEPPEETQADSPLSMPHEHSDKHTCDDTGPADDTAPASDEVIHVPLPERLLASLQSANAMVTMGAGKTGRVGQSRKSNHHGRCIGIQRYQPGRGHKVHLLATLQAAAPWQAHRRHPPQGTPGRPVIKPQDIRAGRYKQATQTVVIFVVDASGSAAQQRLAEAKGAVELLLNECYVRRDEVALIVFQGARATLVLPPTRSLVTARRQLTELPAGGGTPLASAIDQAGELAAVVRRDGNVPLICLLTDGRANVDRHGIGGRARAMDEAKQAARKLAETPTRSLLIDIARRPNAGARELATALGSAYLALPRADAGSINRAVSEVMPPRAERVSAA